VEIVISIWSPAFSAAVVSWPRTQFASQAAEYLFHTVARAPELLVVEVALHP
jgi:hypothetical protein